MRAVPNEMRVNQLYVHTFEPRLESQSKHLRVYTPKRLERLVTYNSVTHNRTVTMLSSKLALLNFCRRQSTANISVDFMRPPKHPTVPI